MIRTIETDPERIINMAGASFYESKAEVYMSTTVRVQIRVFGKWITVLKWDRIA